jgi:outer membrane receptor protein involved in Fe transport
MEQQLRKIRHAARMLAGVVLASAMLMLNPASASGNETNVTRYGPRGKVKMVDFTVSGKIKDENGTPVPGANILLKGTTMGTASDANGDYSLVLPDEKGILIFSFIGFTTQEVEVSGRSMIDVTLISDDVTLSEIIVTGYGTQSKREITGAVSSIDSKDLLSVPATNLAQAMQGRVAGVVVGNENAPGGGVMVRIRGYGTVNDNSPLYVIDGTPT